MAIPFVGKRFDAAGFEAYLGQVQFGTFKPTFVTLHHTGSPTLAQRPDGFSAQHLQNLLHYYQNQLGWSGAPHVFIDDQPKPIIVFQRLDRRGVHAVSFNRKSWGVEMLGFYDSDSFTSGRGAAVRDNAMEALALMCKRLGAAANTIKFHRDDPTTKKSCPGMLVKKSDVVSRVSALMNQTVTDDVSDDAWENWTVMLPGGSPFVPVHSKEGRPIVHVRTFLKALGEPGELSLAQNKSVVRWVRPAGVVELSVEELDAAGSAWCLVRSIADAAGRTISVSERIVSVG
ncbi:MAG: peptidoglycan recognition family protein [Actinomycetota bacterium]